LIERNQELHNVEEEISNLNDIIRKNRQFSDYLETKNIYVKNPSDAENPIRVTKGSLFCYDDIEETNSARKSMLCAKRNGIKREIAAIEASQEKQLMLSNLPTADDEIARRLASITGIKSIEVKSMLHKFYNEKNALLDELKRRTKTNNPWITEAFTIVEKYTTELSIPIDYKIDIFTSNLKAKSGAILHKMVFIYKLAYIELLSKKLGFPMPIFCDSPSGREVHRDVIDKMLNILKRDFANHQIIIASIYKYEDTFYNTKFVDLDGTLFDAPSLFDSELPI
jgi:hypothetical protein